LPVWRKGNPSSKLQQPLKKRKRKVGGESFLANKRNAAEGGGFHRKQGPVSP